MKKKIGLGLYTGRFNPMHIGHQGIINKMLKECNQVLILIGNCQAQRTKNNPLNILERIDLIKKVYRNNKKITIGFYPDLLNKPEVPNYSKLTAKEGKVWGDWILSFCEYYAGKRPDAVYSGSEAKIELFFPQNSIRKIKVDNKTIAISSTKIKELLFLNKKEEWKNYVDKKIFGEYDHFRKIILESR